MKQELKNKLEAILFLSGEGLEIGDLAKFFGISKIAIKKILNEIKEEKKSSGLEVKFYGDTIVQLTTNFKYGETINNFFNPAQAPKKLTNAAMETLAIIAYNCPITKTEIENIRGVNVEKVLRTLEEKNLVRICGKKEAIGNPNLYEITEDFFGYVGIDKIEELPKYGEVKKWKK
ncbi:SMC-Scp complex subunit ScpB [Haliovirga abyssi]|uniref:Segregation and condensation protein B n=1 Tax=Haliovirga abyssi TaxID=2996794 RepID=A0AAU9E3A1_9FUSO|nr:SMC-Scp complex subunit ScpB [Haliovirga abyssi]BDU50925.1 segregation and condensation protein B [Haliovirga abyssi]